MQACTHVQLHMCAQRASAHNSICVNYVHTHHSYKWSCWKGWRPVLWKAPAAHTFTPPIPPWSLLCSSFKGHLSQDQVDIAPSPGKAPSSPFWLDADKRRLCCGHILTFIRLLFIQLSAEAGLGGRVAMAQHAAFQAPPSQPRGGGEGRRGKCPQVTSTSQLKGLGRPQRGGAERDFELHTLRADQAPLCCPTPTASPPPG